MSDQGDSEIMSDDGEFEMEIDMPTMLASFLTSEDGDNVCTALLKMAQQLEVQNKILVKLLNQFSKKSP